MPGHTKEDIIHNMRNKICFIGSGNVATHMARAIHHSGYTICGVYSKHKIHASELAQQIDCAIVTDKCQDLPEADIYIISVKDDAIESVCKTMATAHPEKIFIHTAGSVPLSILTEWFENAAVLYPMQTFSKSHTIRFSEVPLFVEASNEKTLAIVRKLANSISDNVSELNSEGRKRLHLSAVFACNFANHCYTLAYELLKEAHIDAKCLLPLIRQTTEKIYSLEPAKAQTGPAARWDTNVMKAQIDFLKDKPDLQNIYRLMSESIHQYHDKLQP